MQLDAGQDMYEWVSYLVHFYLSRAMTTEPIIQSRHTDQV